MCFRNQFEFLSHLPPSCLKSGVRYQMGCPRLDAISSRLHGMDPGHNQSNVTYRQFFPKANSSRAPMLQTFRRFVVAHAESSA